jgi:hypothetical protein
MELMKRGDLHQSSGSNQAPGSARGEILRQTNWGEAVREWERIAGDEVPGKDEVSFRAFLVRSTSRSPRSSLPCQTGL